MEIEKLYRYPGAVSFTTEQTHLFNGRDRDAKMLWQLISARQVVLLYGKSGTGKSSLINAGIIPIIENEKKVKHFSIRLYNSNQGDNKISSSPLKTLIANLRTPQKTKETNEEVLIEQPWMNRFKKEAYPQGELWYWLKQWQIQQPEKTILLFFDQFEELFTYPPNEIEDFGEELKLLIYQNIPDFLNKRELFKELDETQTALLYEKVNLKLVFSIRSDRMALLNKLTPFIPDVLKYFYELDALTESEARQAIIKPAQLEGEKFISPNFEYESPVIDAIINRVKNSNDDKIETATLQIILRYIEEHKVSKLEGKAISLKLLGNVQDIFKDFYQTSLNKLSQKEKAIASKTIEERFIQNNQRIPFAGEYLKLEDKWTDELFKQLEESTLLRKERDTAGRFIYEIGHDTLIEPILEFAKIREQSNKRKRFINLLSIGLIVVMGLLGVIFYMFSLNNRATALYWASEADKLNPIQGIRLLEEALDKTNDETALQTIQERTEVIFNQSNIHQWHEKNRILSYISIKFSSDYKLVEIVSQNQRELLEVATLKTPTFLQNEGEFIFELSDDAKWLWTKKRNPLRWTNHNNETFVFIPTENTEFKLWDLSKRRVHFTINKKNIKRVYFSLDSKCLFTETNDEKLKIWEMATGKTFDFLQNGINHNSFYCSPDGKWVVTDNFKVWDVVTGKVKYILDNKEDLKFSSDSRWLITNNYSNVKIWDLVTGKTPSFLVKEKGINSILFSANNKFLITDNHDSFNKTNGVKIWDIFSGKKPTFLDHEKNISNAFFTFDGKYLVTSNNKDSKVWDIETGKMYFFFKNEIDNEYFKFSSDKKWFITGDYQTFQIREVSTGKIPKFLTNEKNIGGIDISANSKFLITKYGNLPFSELKVWDFATGKMLIYLTKDDNVLYNYSHFIKGDELLYTLGVPEDHEAKIWRLITDNVHKCLQTERKINTFKFSSNKKYILVEFDKKYETDDKIEKKVFEVETGRVPTFLKNEGTLVDAKFSPDGKWLETENENGEHKIWEIAKNKKPEFLSKEKNIYKVFFSADSKWLVTISKNEVYKVWDVRTGKAKTFLSKEKNISDASFSSDSRWLLTNGTWLTSRYSDEDGKFPIRRCNVWDVSTGKKKVFLNKVKEIIEASFSSNGKWLTIRFENSTKEVWDVTTGEEAKFLKEENNISNISFSDNGKWLITDTDGTYKVWEVSTGKKHNFLKEEKSIENFTFSSNGKWLITMYGDDANKTYKLWDVFTGELHNFLKKEENIRNATFSHDSKLLIIITKHQVKTYEVATGKLIQTLWLNKKPTEVQIIDNRYLYVTVGKAIVKTDLQKQKGNLMSFGDGEPLDYQYDEIMEWKKAFGKEYLLPLDEEIKKKYDIK